MKTGDAAQDESGRNGNSARLSEEGCEARVTKQPAIGLG